MSTPTIPADLLPADGRFGCGPTKVPEAAARAVADHWRDLLGTSHRQAPVKELVGRLQDGLAALFGLPDGHEVLLANGGATAFWDMATFGLIEERSQHYVLGEFSNKFVARGATARRGRGRDTTRPRRSARRLRRRGAGPQRDQHRRHAGRASTGR